MNARGQYGNRLLYGGQPIVGLVRTPNEVEDELNQFHSEVMQFGQEVIEHVDAAQKSVEEEPEYQAILARAREEEERFKTLPEVPRSPFPDVLPGASSFVPPDHPRALSVKRQKALALEAADYLGRRGSALTLWAKTNWVPFRDDWQRFRSSKIDIPVQLWPGSGVWDRVQDYRKKFIEIRSKAPFQATGPAPLSPEDRRDPDLLGGLGDFFKDFKWVLIGVLGIGGVLAASSVASNLKKGHRS